MVFCNMREQERKERNTKYRQVSVSFRNKTNISHAKRVRLYRDETKPYSDLTVYFICFKPPCKKVNRTVCKFFVNCHSAKPFFVFKLIVHPKRSFLFEVKTSAVSCGLRGRKKIQQDLFDGLSFKLYYIRVLQGLLQRL